MKEFIKDKWGLFVTAMLQTAFVAMSTIFISGRHFIPAVTVGFIISFIWTYNVKRAAFGTLADRLVYSIGAAVGTATGYLISDVITKII